MAFKDWLKEYRESQDSQSKDSKTTSATSSKDNKNSTSGSSGSGGSGFSFRDSLQKYRESQATISLDGWWNNSSSLLKEIQERSGNWYDDETYQSQFDRISKLLSQADNWRKQYEGNSEAVSYIDSVVNALSEAKSYAFSARQYYSQWDTEDAYNNWQTFDKDHSTVESRQDWYSNQLGRLNKLKADRNTENSQWAKVDPIEMGAESVEYQTAAYEHTKKLKAIDDEIAAIEAEINNYKRGNYNEAGQYYGSKTVDDYYSISQREDFDAVSANRDFGNATKEDFDKWYYQTYGGVMIDPETGKEIEGSRVNPGVAETSKESLAINDPLGFYLQAKEYRDSGDARYESFGVVSREYDQLMTDASTGSWDELEDTEIGIYYVLLKEQGYDAAMKYLSDMEVELNKRATMNANKNTAAAYDDANLLGKVMLNAASVAAGTLSAPWVMMENVVATAKGEEINPYSTTKAGMHFSTTVRGETANDFNADGGNIPILTDLTGFTKGDAYQAGMSILDSYAAIGIGGKLGGVLLATSAANSEANRLYEQGASMKQIALGSAAAGAAEMVFESLSIDKLITMKDAENIWQAVANALTQAGIEASEEGFTEIANIITNSIIMGNQSDWAKLVEKYGGGVEGTQQAFLEKVRDVVNASIGGFISGAGSAGGPSMVSGVANQVGQQMQYANAGKAINYADGGVDALLSLANEVAGVSEGKTQKALNRGIASVGKNAGNIKVGKLYDTVKTANNQANAPQNQADIAKSLQRKGFNAETANDIAEALVASYNGKSLTKAQSRLLESVNNSDAVKSAISNIIYNTNSTMGQRSQNIRDFDKDITSGIISRSFGLDSKAAKQAVEKQFTPEGTYETSVEGKALRKDTNEDIDIKGIASIKNGEMLLDIGDGNTINAKDVIYASEEQALIYEAVANLGDKVNATTATKLIKQYKGGNAMVFARGMAQAYTYGFYGLDTSELMGKNSLATELTQEQRNYAYNLGNQYRNVKDQADKANARATKAAGSQGVYFRSKDGTVTDFRTYEKESNVVLKDVQKTAIDVMERMSKIMGVRFNVFESWEENGKRYYLDENGVKTEGAPNGFYDPRTGEIYIDLAAGNDFQGTMLFTVAHELTHFMRQWSPEHFTKIARIVFKHGGMKGNVSALVAAKQAKAKAKGKQPISYDTAMEEAVADGMETILKDGKVVEFMADVKQTDHAAWEKIKDWFKNLAKLLKDMISAYSSHSAQTLEGARVAAFAEDLLHQIEQIYAEGAVAAGENYQAAMENVVEKNAEAVSTDEIITDGAVVTDGEGTKFSIKSMKHDIAEGQMFEDLKTYCGWTQKQVNELRQNLNDLVEYMTPFRDILDMNESYGREGRRFSPYKPNSDPLYKISMDFSTLCSKRLLTQYVIENLQLRENRPMSAEEQMAIRDMLNEYRKVEKGLQVACAMCYVEAARLKSPQQIGKWLADPETQMRNYFADKDPEFAAYIKEKQADYKESRGYDRNATKKDMSAKDVRELNKIRPRLRSQYQVSAEEAKIIARAKELPNSTYLTAGNLADLSESDPVIYSAYTAFVRTATRSKSLETDEPYYYGDSRRDNGNGIIVSDSFIEAVNRENGMRFSSWSDWRIQHLLDYIVAVIDNSVRGAAMHGYTKFGEEVRVLGKTGMMFNMSGVAGTQTGLNEDGSLSFSPTESMDVNEAIQLREEFPETAGLQCIGVSDAHIIALLRSDIIDYIIPYHVSGLNAALRRMADIFGWSDYTTTQHAVIDKNIKLENAVDKEHWHEEPVWSEYFVGYNTGMTGIDAMRASAERYVQMCKDRGLKPKFEQFLKEENYWKLLIDRKMINQKTGDLIRQKAVTPTFDFGTIKEVVDRYVQNYDSGLEARALNHIVENWDSIPKRIKDLKKQGGTKAKKTSKAVDTLANETLAAQPTKQSDRFVEDKYFARQIDKLSDLREGSYVTVGKIIAGSPIERVGIPAGNLYFDVSKIRQEMVGRKDPIPPEIIKSIPKVLDHPMLITEFVDKAGKHSINVYGKLYIGSSPVVIGIMIGKHRNGQTVDKIQTVHPNRNFLDEVTDSNTLYLGENKKETNAWFQALGAQEPPLGGTKYGFIRMISQPFEEVKKQPGRNAKMSDRDTAPTFYSHMARIVDGVKQDKLGAASVVSMLRGKGVKAEEIKWSGIEEWLAGKKSVTKEELQEFIAGSMMRIEEEQSSRGVELRFVGKDTYKLYDIAGRVLDTFKYDKQMEAYVSEATGETYSYTYEIEDAVREEYDNHSMTRWAKYKLNGGFNYRELVFRLPNNSYSNQAMRAHWGDDAEGILVHARIQDFNTFLGKMLFVEELQSDYHNEGHESGYADSKTEENIEGLKALAEEKFFALEDYSMETTGAAGEWEEVEKTVKGARLLLEYHEAQNTYDQAMNEFVKKIPDAPFKDTYHEYVLKRLLRMAAEEGYDSIGWTPSEVQVKRWSEEFTEGYRIEYDQDIPKFLNKYGKKWGTRVGKTMLDNGTEVWAMAITDEMKDSVLSEGQPLYSDRADASNEKSPVYTGEYPNGLKFQHREDNPTMLKMLNDQVERGEYTTVYKALLKIGDTYYPPMASLEKDENGRYTKLRGGQKLFDWIASDGKLTDEMKAKMKMKSPKAWLNKYADAFKDGRNPWGMYGDFNLKKADESGKSQGAVPAAYNPYQHSSDLVLNDQFEAAYDRPGLVVVECRIPNSELNDPYWAPYAKDPTGMHEWKTGPVAGQLKKTTRHVYMTRWIQPIRELAPSEVAQKIRDIVAKEDAPPRVYWNTISPKVLPELIKLGVEIDPYGSPNHMASENALDMYGNPITDEIRAERKAEKEAKKSTKKASKESVLYQDRETESVSNRSLLANALEGAVKNDIERNKIQEYKSNIDLINAEERKLRELNEKIKELSFAKGPKDTKAIRSLQFEARQTANRISTYDKILLRLEASKPLQDVLTREKEMVRKREKQKGKEALEAYREKTMKTQRELLEKWQESRKKGIDSRNRTAMRHKIKDIVNELNQYLLRGTKDRHVPIELQKAVAEALDAVNMDTVGAEERIAKLQDELLKAKTPEQIQEIAKKIDHIQQMGDKMNGRLQKLKDAYDQFVNSDDPMIANSHDEVISNKLQSVIDSIGNTPLRDMTLAQLEDVHDMYRMVLTTIRNANKAFKAKKSESISTIANRVMEEVENVGGKKKLTMKGMDGIKSFVWNNLKPVYAFEHIGSDTFTEVFNAVRAGEDVWAVDVTEAREFYLDKSKKHGYNSWDLKKRYNFKSTSGMDFSLDLEQIMSLYAYSKRDQAADHLKKGGIVIDETTEITIKNKLGIPVKFNPTEATAYNISEPTLAEIISKLTDEQKAFVDEMQDYLSTVMGAKGNEVSLEMYGIKLFKEKFYFPLKSAHQFMAKAKEQQKGEIKIKNSGFSKETVQKASNPIVLTPFMNVWSDHVNEMSMYHAFVLPMEDFYRVYNYKTPTSETMATESVEMFIQNAYGKGATKYIDQLLKDLNGGARTDSTTGFINKMMGLFKKGSVFASLSVVVQQPSAIARAAALVDTKYFIGPKVDHKRHKALWDEVKQYAPVAIIKEMGYFDTNMGKSTQDFILAKEYSGFKEKMSALVTDSGYRDEALSKAPALADEIAWCGIWEAVKRETHAKYPGMDVKSEAFLKMAGERFTEVIVKTQVYDSVLSRSGMMRSKDTGMKMATAFMAEPTTSINMIADALLQGKRGNKKYARAAIGAVIASQIINSILVSFVYAGRDDDEDETYWEKYIGTLSGEVLDSLNPAGYIPFIKDIMSIVQGYDVERSDMAVVSDLWKAIENLKKDNVSVYRKVEGFAGSVAQIFGLPVKNIMRDARGIYQTIMSFVNGQQTTAAGIGYAVKGAITGKTVSDQQQLYEAYLSGDKAQIARVKGRFKDQSAINTAIRKALRENDPRIQAAAVARYNGNIAEYTRIAKEIINEKHFSQDDVVAAINAEINAMDKGETTSSAPKASGLYKAEDFAVAISNGDQAMANAVKTDIIRTAQKNGKSETEATKSFNSAATTACKDLFLEGKISDDQAVDALTTYCGRTEDEALADVQYWAFKQDYPDVYADDAWFDKYYEDVADSGIDIDVYMEYRNQVKDIDGEGKKERRMAVIHSLPITSAQKDALYYAEGWAASKLNEAPWH